MAGIMRVSDAASLGLHAAAYLAAREGERVPTAEVAEALGVSSAHLAKVLRELERAGIVRAKRGPTGGFELARDAARVTLKEVYEAVEGPIETERCLLDEPACGGRCILGGLIRSVDGEVRRKLGGVRLVDVADRFRGRGGARRARAGERKGA
ncbi:MAG: RrF2 family transcriptional regulator [Planctomycetota bacterium]